MDSESTVDTQETFRRANQLWFWEGYTHEAVCLYEQAARVSNTDPAILLQWARAQRALGQPDAAHTTLNRARSLAAQFNLSDASYLQQVEHLWASTPLPHLPAGLQPTDLDVRQLAELSLSSADWRELAAAAASSELYGVAFYARDRSKGSVTVVDEERDDWALIQRAERELAILEALHG